MISPRAMQGAFYALPPLLLRNAVSLRAAGGLHHLDADRLQPPACGDLLVLDHSLLPGVWGLGLFLRNQGQGFPRVRGIDVLAFSPPSRLAGTASSGRAGADTGQSDGPGRATH